MSFIKVIIGYHNYSIRMAAAFDVIPRWRIEKEIGLTLKT